MSKVLKIAAFVVGVAAVIVTGGVALFGAPAVLGALAGVGISISAATLATVGTVLTVASAVLSVAAGLTAKKPKLGSSGTQLDFIADPAAGEPYVMGDAMVGMDIVHEATWGSKNKNLGIIGVMSLGPIMAYDGFYADGNLINFTSSNATGYYHNFMYLKTQLGAVPESVALTPAVAGMPDWGSTHKLSGLAAAALVLVADTDNGKIYAGGTPKMTNRIRGVLAYDARADSTNGGSGSQRYLNEATYSYSENPWVHHGTYALGRYQNGTRVIGPGLPPDKIDWGSHIEAANIAATNNWKISGRIMSTDRKWDVMKAIAQAGGGYPVPSGAKLHCLINTPRVSLATINSSDLKGPVTAPQMAMRRDRINGGIPRFRSKDHGWEIIPGNTIRNSTYLAEDGGQEHTREIEYPLVADKGDGLGKTQAAQLVGYDIANTREKIGIQLELGLQWSQYIVGDCLTLNLPEALLINQKAIVIGRTFNATRSTITLEFRTEDDNKHTWVLGLTGSTTVPTTWIIPPGTAEAGLETSAETQQFIIGSGITGLTFSVGIPSGGNSTVIISNHNRVYSDKTRGGDRQRRWAKRGVRERRSDALLL
jgi:hypothetical protein